MYFTFLFSVSPKYLLTQVVQGGRPYGQDSRNGHNLDLYILYRDVTPCKVHPGHEYS